MYTFDWLVKRAELTPDTTALVDAATGREWSYEQFNERASRFAEFLRDEWTIRSGERIAILAQNSTDYFEILYGCAKVGTILVPLNWRLAVPELEFIVRDCEPRALIYDPPFSEAAEALRTSVGIERWMTLGAEPREGEVAYEGALSEASGRSIVMPSRGLDEVWHILYTSGTTGCPKGVLQTFGMVLYNALNIGVAVDLTSEDTSLNLLPCFHTGGLNLFTNPTFHVGGTAIVQRTFEPEETLRWLATRATVFFGVPAVYQFLIQHHAFEETEFRTMRSWSSGGSAMPISLLERYAERGIRIRQGFGMTETGPTVFLVDEEQALSKAGSVGKPQMHVAVRIVDREGQDVPRGEMGELLIKGPGVTPGYWQLPEVTAEAIEDGWLHSGDVARCDEAGYYYIVDRWKDMFISGGENVYPAEVENALHAHPAIADVAVVGQPDEKWGEVGHAFVVVKEGEALSGEEVIAFCQGRLARYKVPKAVSFLDSLPRNAAGKVLKTELRMRHLGLGD